jgi:hypothetical protein
MLDHSALHLMVTELNDEIERLRAERDEPVHRAVHQESMEGGEIEMF